MSAPTAARHGFGTAELRAVLGRPISDEQLEVIRAPLAPGVVVAGAGSGKTATMVARVVWLVAQGAVTPEGVLGLTFTSKAANELASRVRTALRLLRASGGLPAGSEDEPGEPTVSTYHAYAGRLVREHALRVGREPAARILTPASSWQLAARVVGTYDGPLADKAESTVVQQVLGLAGDLAEHLVGPADVLQLGAELARLAEGPGVQKAGRDALAVQREREQLLPLVERYTAMKREREALDFADVVALAAELARDCPEVGALERASFPVVLLDEYQDTGAAQEVLLAALYGPQAAGPQAAGHALLAVGDPCQSIYGWRGASAGTLRRFAGRFAAAAEPLHLSTTYRSGGRILLLANEVARELPTQGLVVPELAAQQGREHEGQVRCALLPDVADEARWVAESVREALLARAGDGAPRWAEAAVLCRKRSMFPALRSAFEALQVPVEVVGLGGLLDVPEVADIVATLRVLDDPTADASLLRLLTGPRWRLGPRDLVALGRMARALAVHAAVPADPVQAVVAGADDEAGGSLVDALDALPEAADEAGRAGISARGHARLHQLRGELRAVRRRLDQPLPELVLDVERTLLLDVEVVARPGAPPPAEARADLDAFAEAAARFAGETSRDGGGEAVLSAFLAFLSAADEEENGLDAGAPGGGDTVTLMTVHAAKGLEWPIVAVPGLAGSERGSRVFPGKARGTSWLKNARLLPFPLRGDRGELPRLDGLDKASLTRFERELRARDEREEQRLAYVAFTRAESLLLCSGYHWGDGKLVLGPSVLLEQARRACEAGGCAPDRWDEAGEQPPAAHADDGAGGWPQASAPAAAAVQAAGRRVRELMTYRDCGGDLAPTGSLGPEAAARISRWDEEMRLLAREQSRRAAGSEHPSLPASLSVTTLVELRRDPVGVARALRRPLPRRPSPVSRRGTAFHAWLEQVYAMPQLLAPEELPGAADAGAGDGADLRALQRSFRDSDWWGRTPIEVEVPFDMAVGGHQVRGRIDAVFTTGATGATGATGSAGAGQFEVVDWKTGREPSGSDAQAAAVQLAAYRLAWAHLAGVAPEQVRSAFHYVATGVTVRPVDLLDADGLAALVVGRAG